MPILLLVGCLVLGGWNFSSWVYGAADPSETAYTLAPFGSGTHLSLSSGTTIALGGTWKMQPWDPDFTYGFGYFDWHPGTISSVQYNNYSGNRFAWKNNVPGTGRFRDGSISISWSWSW